MVKFVFLNYGEGYQECIFNALRDDNEAYFFEKIKSPIIKKLFLLHNAWPINKKQEMPFKGIWFKRVMKNIEINREDDIYFLAYESFHLTYSKSFLMYLKKKYPKSKICYMFSNPVDSYNRQKLITVSEYFDAIISFNQKDAEENGYLFCPMQPYRVPVYEVTNEKKSDVFFIGADKGRLDKLIKIYENLTNKGITCDFYVVGVPEEKQKYANKIHYNKRLTYDEVLKKVATTNCVLEVLQNSENYISIRTIEAMQYHTKLLTSNSSIKNFEFYSPKIIQVFDDTNNIDVSFFRENVDRTVFPSDSLCLLGDFKKFLLKNVKGK